MLKKMPNTPMLVEEIKKKGRTTQSRLMTGWTGQVIVNDKVGTPRGFWGENPKKGETFYAVCDEMVPGANQFEGKNCRFMSCKPDAEEGSCQTEQIPYIKLIGLTLEEIRPFSDLKAEPNAKKFYL